MEEKRQLNDEKVPGGNTLPAGDFARLGPEGRKAMLKAWQKIDSEAVSKLSG